MLVCNWLLRCFPWLSTRWYHCSLTIHNWKDWNQSPFHKSIHPHSKYQRGNRVDGIFISFQEPNNPKCHSKFIFLNVFLRQSLTIRNPPILSYRFCPSKYFKVLCLCELHSFCAYKSRLKPLVWYNLKLTFIRNVYQDICSSCTCKVLLVMQIRGRNKLRSHLKNDCKVLWCWGGWANTWFWLMFWHVPKV